ncbi:MAG: class I SAM-dependent methyltransferase [Lachnospiraceae bacterium]
MIQLSDRLTAVAALVTEFGTLADVGTDHGYIPVFLAKEKRIERGIAMDVNQGPLLRAKEHIIQYGLEDVIQTRRSDGLEALHRNEADTIVIAGMGGGLMTRILAAGKQTAASAKELILQPQSELEAFRRFLQENKFQIVAENMIFEDGKYYPMMRVIPKAKEHMDSMSLLEYRYGPLLLKEKHPVLIRYLQRQKVQKQGILKNLTECGKGDTRLRQEELQEELMNISKALEYITEKEME